MRVYYTVVSTNLLYVSLVHNFHKSQLIIHICRSDAADMALNAASSSSALRARSSRAT